MSFWGCVLKPGETKSLVEADGEILHLSQACLCEPKDAGKSYLKIQEEGKAYAVACLQKDVQEHCAFDIFLTVSSDLKLTNAGKNEIHVVGYFEPQDDDMDDDSEDEPPALMNGTKKSPMAAPVKSPLAAAAKSPLAAAAKSPLQQALAAKAKSPVMQPADDDDDDDDEDDEEDDDEEDDDEMDDDEEDDEDDDDDLEDDEDDDEDDDEEDDEEDDEPAPPAGKRKAASPTPEAKKPKTASPMASPKGGSEEDKFAARVKEFVKSNGKTPMSMLGSKIQKPASINQKLSVFVKSRPELVVDGQGNVSAK